MSLLYIMKSMLRKIVIMNVISTDLRADSTNTLNAFKWIQATNTSLKFNFSHRTKTPCGGDMHIYNTLRHTQLYSGPAYMMFDSHIAPSCEHWAASSPAASSPPDQSCTHARRTCVDHRPHYGNWHRQHSFDWWFMFCQSVLLTCSPELWLWMRTQLFWTAWLRKRLPLHPRTASWLSHRIRTEN